MAQMYTPEYVEALLSLGFTKPVVYRDGVLETYGEPLPFSDDEIQQEIARMKTAYDAQAYARKRRAEYPTIEDCVHAMLDGGLDELQAKRHAVKQKYPKE